ncbi:MAG: MerR family transcriptional regulator [Synergistaceae bacterium]|nr:MerR family transcriptional regulator [Synergistaceae bacterium]
MKIGAVSEKYGISRDTIYFYINYGLLVPPKHGGQQDFDEKTLADLEMILELKKLEFSLGDIHRILSLHRVSKMASSQDIMDLKRFFTAQRDALVQRRDELSAIVGELGRKISTLNENARREGITLGVPLSMLGLIRCPSCGREPEIFSADMSVRHIYSGALKCLCGYSASIENGILLTPNRNVDVYDTPDLNRDMYKNLPPHLITLFERAYNRMTNRLKAAGPAGKVVMETYVNAWFFMHNHLGDLHRDGKYIVVDKYPETLAMYKELIECQNVGLDVLYIADSGTKLPLKNGCVDVNIDFFAVNEHNFYHDTFLLNELKPYFSKDAVTIGTYFYFEKGRRSMKRLLEEYPTCSGDNFNLQRFRISMEKAGYEISGEDDCGRTDDSGDNIGFSFHEKGEEMGLLSYIARMNATPNELNKNAPCR